MTDSSGLGTRPIPPFRLTILVEVSLPVDQQTRTCRTSAWSGTPTPFF